MNEIELKPTYWASVSGGKDSLYMLKIILENPNKYPLNGVVHFELEIDYPFIKNVISYMEIECEKRGIPFVKIRPRNSWFELYNKYKFPTHIARWCNSKYKLDASKQLKSFLKDKGYKLVTYIGYCVDEFARYDKRKNPNECYPLVLENIEERIIWEWARQSPIFNDYYKFNKRCGCMICPLTSMANQRYLLEYYPNVYNEMMGLAKETEVIREKELGRPFSVWSSNPKYNTEYRDKRIRELELKEVSYD